MSSSSQNKRQEEGSPVSRKQLDPNASKSKLNSVQISEREQESQEPDTESPDTQESQQPGNQSFYLEYVYYRGRMIQLGSYHGFRVIVLQFGLVRFWLEGIANYSILLFIIWKK